MGSGLAFARALLAAEAQCTSQSIVYKGSEVEFVNTANGNVERTEEENYRFSFQEYCQSNTR